MTKTELILKDIIDEMAKAKAKYGDFPTIYHGSAIVRKEENELFAHVISKESESTQQKQIYHAAIQVAATAIRFAEEFGERNG
jgi:hypothetical protein